MANHGMVRPQSTDFSGWKPRGLGCKYGGRRSDFLVGSAYEDGIIGVDEAGRFAVLGADLEPSAARTYDSDLRPFSDLCDHAR